MQKLRLSKIIILAFIGLCSCGLEPTVATPIASLTPEADGQSNGIPFSQSPTVQPTATYAPSPTQPTATYTPSPTDPPTNTPVPTPTATPEGYFPQIFLGFQEGALRPNSCGKRTFITMDYDERTPGTLDYWQFTKLPAPLGYSRGTRDGRRGLDICTKPGFVVYWMMDTGKVVENRATFPRSVLSIEILAGEGQTYTPSVQHLQEHTNPYTLQELHLRDIINFGQPIGITGAQSDPESDATPTFWGVFPGAGGESSYSKKQEFMIIGPDGIPNILYIPNDDNGIPNIKAAYPVFPEQVIPPFLENLIQNYLP